MASWWEDYKKRKGLSSGGSDSQAGKTYNERMTTDEHRQAAKSSTWWEDYKKKNDLERKAAADRQRAAQSASRLKYRSERSQRIESANRQLEQNRNRDAAEDEIRELFRNPFSSDAEWQAGVLQRNAERYRRDLPLYQQAMQNSSTWGEYFSAHRQAGEAQSAVKHQFERYQQAAQKAEQDRNESNLVNRPAQWQAENLTPQEIEQRLAYYQSEAATPTVTDRDREEHAYLYPEAALKKVPHGVRFDERLLEDMGQDAIDALYRPILTEQEKAAVEEADRQIIEEKASRNYEQVQRLLAAQAGQTEAFSRARGNELIEEIAQGGEAAKQVESGRALFEQQQKKIDDESPTIIYGAHGNYSSAMAERTKRGYILGSDWDNVPEDRKQAVYALFTESPEKAIELAKFYIADAQQAEDEERQAWYAQNGWTAALGLVSSAAAHLGAAVDPFGDVGQELTRRGDNALAGGSQWADAATGYQKIPEWVPIVGGKGAGDFYQTVGSVVQSAAVAAPAILVGRYDKAAAEVVGKLGLALMGSSAAASDYRESVAAGMDEDRAKLHALAAGVEEALFEEVSLDKLIKMDTSGGLKSALKNWLVQSGVEGSEELATSIANRFTDEMISGAGQSKVERRASELIANGMNSTQAHTQAENEWMTDTLYEGFSGFLSGGMMTGGNYALKGLANLKERAVNAAATSKVQKQAGAAVSRSEGSVEALQAYAKDKGIEIKAVETAEQNAEQGGQGADQNSYSARDYRSISDTNSKVVQSIRNEVRGKTAQEQQAVRDSLVEKYGEGIAPVVNNAISLETASRVRQEYGSVDSIQAARNQAVSEIKDESLRRAVSDGYDSAAYFLAASQGGEGGMNTMSRYIQQRNNTGTGEMSMNATVTAQDGSTKAIAITGMSEDGKRVSLADGSEVAVKDLQADADTTSAIQQLADLDLGADATKVLQAYQQSGVAGTEGYRWLMDYATAYNQGRTRQISLEQAAQRSSLDERTVMDAYTLGQQASNRETLAGLEKLKNLPKRKGASGRTANIDTAEIKGKTMSKSELEQFELANQYAQALGVDMTWFSSKEKDGKFVGKNGAYENGKIYMDIHAGRNFAADLTSGILATMGHELSHFEQQYAPEEYQALKEFLFEQIVKSSPNGEARLERLIWEKQRRSGNTLSRKAAEDEVVADACQKMLRDSKTVHDFASQQPQAANGVVRWLDKWFKRVRSIFGRGGNYSEEAQLMDSLEQDVKAAFGELWDKALKQAVQVHDEVGNIKEESKAQNSDRDTEYLELAKDPKKNADRLQEMVDEAAKRAGYTIKAYHGTYSQFTAFSPEKSSKNNDYGPGIYLTNDEANARGYAGTNGIWNADLSNNVDIYAQEEANEKFDQEEDYSDWVDAYNAAWDRKAKEIEENGRVLSLYARGKKLFTVSLDVQITIDEAIKILQAMPKSVQADVKEWQMEVKRIAGKNNTISTYAFANSNWSLYLSYALNNLGYSGIEDTSVNKKFSLFFGTEHYVIFNATDVKSADPVTYDDSGNVIPLSERFNEENEDIRYSERDNAKPRSVQAQRDAGYKLSESKFYSLYSAHKLNMIGKGNVQERISSIMADGFKGDGGFGNNVMPTNISYDVDENGKRIPRGLSAQKYAPKKGEYILLVPKEGVEVKGGRYNFTERVKPGYKPAFDYEIVQADYDGQPYYEMYEKAYDKSQAEKADVTLDGAQFSERDYFDGMSEEQVQEELTRLQQEKANAREKQRSLEKTDEYKRMFQDVLDKRSPEAISAFNKWADESGYVAAVDRAKEVDARRSEGAKVLDRLIDQRLEREELEAIQKSGKSEAEYFAAQAVKNFGYTPYFYDAGYIVPNGKMLNFSGQKGRHFGSRGQDHRAIGQIYAATNGSAAMNRFMNQGNVRIMAESPGIDISNATPLTKEQYATIRRFVNEVRSDEYFNLDFSDERGNNIGSIEYEGRFTADRVLNDIRHFFDTGEVRQPSGLSAFYSERDYSAPSDEELLMNARVEDADNADQGRLLKDYQALGKRIATLEKQLADARRQTQLTNRALNTRGIGNVVKTVMKDYDITDARHNGTAKNATLALTDGYQKALDLLDKGASPADVNDAVYNGAVKAAEIILEQGTYSQNLGGKWQTYSASRYLGENSQELIDSFVSEAYADFVSNRYREARPETAADRLVARTKKEAQERVDKYKGRSDALAEANRRLEEKTTQAETEAKEARKAAGELFLEIKDLRQELMDNKTMSEQERKAASKKLKSLNKSLEAKREEAASWQKRAKRNASLLKSALESKSRDISALNNRLSKEQAAALEKQKNLEAKLEKQIQRERDILAGKLRAPELVKLLKAEREKAETRVKKQKEQVFQNYKERKKAGELRGRIKNLSDEMKRRMTNPTDRAYVPASLYQSMTKLADVLDNVLSPNPGTKAEARYRAMMDAIRGMAREYEDVKNLDPVFASEYEQEISDAIGEIERILERKNASWIDNLTGDTQKSFAELNSDELQQLYDLMRQINYTITNATKVFGNSNYKSIFDAQRAVAEQQNSMKSLNAVSRLERKKRLRLLNSLSVMRATEMMAGWDRSAALYQLMHGIEQGADAAWAWVMDYNKSMQDLKTGKNEKEYRQALTKQLDFGITDRDGLKVTMTKMQALQILMTAEREEHNDKLLHLQAGGAVIRNATDLQNGKGAKARSQTISVTPELIQKINDSLTDWDRAYMKTVRDYFKREGKRTNEILYKLKHKVLKTEEFYVPYTVDRNYLEANLNEQQALNMWVKTPGSTNALKQKAKQPVIIDGMDTVMGQHVKEIGNYIGMAIPIRDFSKVYNGMIPTEGPNPLPVKETIERTFGKAGQHLLTQAVIDVQGGTARQNWESNIAQFLNKLQGAFVRSALLINPSVTIKQAASYIAAESVISHLALERGNHSVWARTDESKSFMPGGLIAQLFARPEGKTAQRIYNEIDQHTSLHYQRRQGMSMAEIAEQANRTGPIKRRMNAIGASMEQSKIGHVARRTGENLNPLTWIQRMDVATTAALWVACKEQAKLDKLTVGSEEFWKRTTELYERCIRETQPMYDGLHRTANQKQAGGLMQYLFPFRTVPIQNHGQLAASYEAYKAARESKNEAKIKEAGKFFRKTVWAQTESAFVFSVMTFLAAILKRKTKKYRDEEGELDAGSFTKGLLTDVGSTLISVLNPMYGSELFNLGSRAVDKFEGNSGYTYDAFSVGVVDMINDLASSGDRLLADAGKIVRGENVNAADFWNHAMNLLVKGGKLAGIPADTVKTYFEGTKGNIQDAIEGRIPALNDESWERDAATNARRYLKAYLDNDTKKASAVLAELRSNLSKNGKDEEKINEAIRKAVSAQAVEKVADGTWTEEEAEAYLLSTGAYDDRENPQKDAWNAIRKGVAKSTSTDDEFNWKQYDELAEAVANGEDVTDILTEYRNHGYSDDQINGAIKSGIQEALTSGDLDGNEAADALIRYGVTYSKDGKAVAYDEQTAWKKVQEWIDKAEHTDEEGELEDGYKYSAYNDLFEAVDANQNADGIIQTMVQNGGYDTDSLRGKIKEHLLERFIAGQITETALKNHLSRYCKITKTEDANEIVKNAKCKHDFGVYPDDLKEAFKDGDLSQNQAEKALQQYKGLSKTDAQNRVQYWGYDGDLSENAWLKWNNELKGSGLSVNNWEKVYEVKSSAKGTDANGDGRADSGTVKAEVVAYIDSMNIPKSQKKAIYLAFGWAASTMPNWR